MAQRPRLWQRAGINPEHAAQLQASAISLDIAKQRGVATVTDMAVLERAGFNDVPLPGLLFPIWSVRGKLVSYQYRPDNPRLDDKGRQRKYEDLQGVGKYPDIHPSQYP